MQKLKNKYRTMMNAGETATINGELFVVVSNADEQRGDGIVRLLDNQGTMPLLATALAGELASDDDDDERDGSSPNRRELPLQHHYHHGSPPTPSAWPRAGHGSPRGYASAAAASMSPTIGRRTNAWQRRHMRVVGSVC